MLKNSGDELQHQFLSSAGRATAAPWIVAWTPTWSRERVGKFLLTTAQLGILLLAMHVFQVEESSGLLKLTGLIFGGFLVHAALPLAYRPAVFLLVSLVGFGMVLGAPAFLLVGIGLVLIGACHVPVPFRWRVGLVVALGAALVALKAAWLPWEWTQSPWTARVLPVVGSMFMFRLIIYLYDLRHETKGQRPVSLWQRLSYFFLLPNVCFLLFPIIDYRAYQRAYYDIDALEIYQRGALRIFRGLTHLLLYRVVYYYLTPAPDVVVGLGEVALFVISAWLLYLRVSGVFHISLGVLGLFGYNMPDVMRLYFLASGPNDLWRRANIYWKDFMMKAFYYPVFMPLQKRWGKKVWGLTAALVVATVWVFVATWLLHSYQWFWVMGTFPLAGIDAVFWSIFLALVLANSLWELKRGKRRTLPSKAGSIPTKASGRAGWSVGRALAHTGQVAGMFVFMAAMWSWWSSRNTDRWLSVLGQAGHGSIGAAASAAVLVVVGVVAVGVMANYAAHRGWLSPWAGGGEWLTYRRSAMVTSVGALVIVAGGMPEVQRVVARAGAVAPAQLVSSLQRERLNEQDAGIQIRGYYETLLASDVPTWQRAFSQGRQQPRQETRPLAETAAVQYTGNALFYELKPSYEIALKRPRADKGTLLRTNEWGMRDKPYALKKPRGTFRIALIGSSISMGQGVEVEQTYQALLEERLNRKHAGGKYDGYEILNFSVGGYGLVQHATVVERKVFAFEPDVVLYAAHSGEYLRTLQLISRLVTAEAELPSALQDLLRRAGVKLGADDMRARLFDGPISDEVRKWGYGRIVELSRQHGVTPVWAFVPQSDVMITPPETVEFLSGAAKEAGFEVIDLRHAFDGYAADDISVVPWDYHPNALGHRLLADALYDALIRIDPVLQLGLTNAGAAR